jgi:hypothetical protein
LGTRGTAENGIPLLRVALRLIHDRHHRCLHDGDKMFLSVIEGPHFTGADCDRTAGFDHLADPDNFLPSGGCKKIYLVFNAKGLLKNKYYICAGVIV